MTRIELVADWRGAPPDVAADLVRQWAAEDPAADLIAGATFVLAPDAPVLERLPAGWRVLTGEITPGLWQAVLASAGRLERPAVALLVPMPPACDALGVLLDLLASDDMYGAAALRLQCWDGCCCQILSRPGDQPPEWMPLDVLADLPPHELLGDILAPCVVGRPILLTDFGEQEPPFETLAGTVLHRLMAARRCGFRTVLSNRAVVRVASAPCHVPPPPPLPLPVADAKRLRAFDQDAERGWAEFRGASNELLEQLTGRLLKARAGARRPSLLLDMRNVRGTFNGTTFAALGAAWGLHQAADGWDVAILAHPDGASFHDLESAFPGWTVHTTLPPAGFNVALRLSQPWHIQEMIDLHQVARLNTYLMLDTIAWDVLYVAPPHLDGTWRFLTATADGLLFISEFSDQRFCARFRGAAARPRAVCHLSFDPRDYTRAELIEAAAEDYLLVVGNHLDHKDVSATVAALASAFPCERIEVLGPSPVRSPRVRAHTSGTLAERDVHQLYSSAKVVVFPSFYEGFGFPVVTALAYGRTLLARESSLLHEVAAHCPPGGRLIAYRQRDEVVSTIGRLLHGAPVAEVPVGRLLNGRPPRSWRQVGHEIDGFLRTLMASASPATWRARDELVSQALAYKT